MGFREHHIGTLHYINDNNSVMWHRRVISINYEDPFTDFGIPSSVRRPYNSIRYQKLADHDRDYVANKLYNPILLGTI